MKQTIIDQVIVKDDTVYITGYIVKVAGKVDGNFGSWIELSRYRAEQLIELLSLALKLES